MIKVNQTGELEIHLKGKRPQAVLWQVVFALLLGLSLLVWLAFYFLGSAFGAVLTVFSVLLMAFLLHTQRKSMIADGVLTVNQGSICHKKHGKTLLTINHDGNNGKVKQQNDSVILLLTQEDKAPLVFSGFEYEREAQVMLECLQGKKINVRKKEIKMQA